MFHSSLFKRHGDHNGFEGRARFVDPIHGVVVQSFRILESGAVVRIENRIAGHGLDGAGPRFQTNSRRPRSLDLGGLSAKKTLYCVLDLRIDGQVQPLLPAAGLRLLRHVHGRRRAAVTRVHFFRHHQRAVPHQFDAGKSPAVLIAEPQQVGKHIPLRIDPFAFLSDVKSFAAVFYDLFRFAALKITFDPIKATV